MFTRGQSNLAFHKINSNSTIDTTELILFSDLFNHTGFD